jgi:hypothetical protein
LRFQDKPRGVAAAAAPAGVGVCMRAPAPLPLPLALLVLLSAAAPASSGGAAASGAIRYRAAVDQRRLRRRQQLGRLNLKTDDGGPARTWSGLSVLPCDAGKASQRFRVPASGGVGQVVDRESGCAASPRGR